MAQVTAPPQLTPLIAAALAALLAPIPARAADLFSPGPLSRAHQSLEGGLETCTKCHVAGKQLAPERCLECHTELKARVEEKRGFHGRLPPADRQCWNCHHEHQGREEQLVDWGKGGERGFDHSRTGYELRGKHRTAECARCHDPRRIADKTVTAVLEKEPGRKTFLGQPQACSACHFDEHRGQLGADCQRCHSEDGWKPVRGFDHARTAFPLAGRHARTDCQKCHFPKEQPAPSVPPTLTPPIDPARFVKWKGLSFRACTDCHFDEHRGQLGAACQHCHSEVAWKPARGFDHARTAFPLTGRHARTDCLKCHLPQEQAAPSVPPNITPPVNPTRTVKWKGIAFSACTDCHKDPHQGRFGPSCTQCHGTEDWKRMSGPAEKRAFHEATRYPLRGAHAEVACQACHGPFPGEPARYRGLAFQRCSDCHADAHLGQMKPLAAGAPGGPPGCERCHTLEAYLPARFEVEDHTQTGFPLEGAHRAVACVLCHPKDPRLATHVPATVRADLERRKRPLRLSLARFEPSSPADCRACHRDPHAGQFDRRVRTEGCQACHSLASFRTLQFDHARDASFPLTGRHAQAACASCHRPDASGVVRYSPLAFSCSACHSDPHAGQFSAGKGKGTDCSRCHGATDFKDVSKFVHRPPFTDYRLTGKHQGLACEKCHPAVQVSGVTVRKYRPLPTRCEGCHDDFHKGAFRGFVP
ncbi:MAG TPA: cytochrome c3 family protein [Anaeromyxobacter sp.]|nr:cytochrome c3 family protein [Anaeromyxobacter sp.]